jgi:transposase
MRQTHRPGERGFIDFSGKKPRIWDRETGESIEVELFVMVLGASNYTYATATRTQRVDDFVDATIRGLEYFEGVPEILVPDQLKSAVKKSDWWEPEINDTFAEMGQHYGTAIVPARPRRPKDKAKVEAGVLVAQRWILARLRNRRFFSLEELNEAIAALLEDLNTRPFKKLDGCRRSVFESVERPAMRPLPLRRYEIARWKKARVNVDYHVEYDDRLYSVPCPLIGEPVEIRATSRIVEVWHKNARVASHARCYGPKGTMTTCPKHRPRSHRELGDWPPERLVAWGGRTGPATAAVVTAILARGPHPECGRRSCLGLLRMGERYGKDRLEAACERALQIGNPTRKSVMAILKNGLDRLPVQSASEAPVITHENIRGGEYFDRREGEELAGVEIESYYLQEERVAIITDAAPEAVAAPSVELPRGQLLEATLEDSRAPEAADSRGGLTHGAGLVVAALKRAEQAWGRVYAGSSSDTRPSRRDEARSHSGAGGRSVEGMDESNAWPHAITRRQYH